MVSPRKYQLFQQKLTCLGQSLLIKEIIPCITPLRSRVDTIQRFEPPKTPKECKKFCGHKLFVHVPVGSSEEVNSYLEPD